MGWQRMFCVFALVLPASASDCRLCAGNGAALSCLNRHDQNTELAVISGAALSCRNRPDRDAELALITCRLCASAASSIADAKWSLTSLMMADGERSACFSLSVRDTGRRAPPLGGRWPALPGRCLVAPGRVCH